MDDPEPTPPPTVLDRLTAARMSRERIDDHLAAGRILLDGEPVTDLQQPAPTPSRLVVSG